MRALCLTIMSRSRHARAPTYKNSKGQLRQTPKGTAKQATRAIRPLPRSELDRLTKQPSITTITDTKEQKNHYAETNQNNLQLLKQTKNGNQYAYTPRIHLFNFLV
jgi:hypothetical protein